MSFHSGITFVFLVKPILTTCRAQCAYVSWSNRDKPKSLAVGIAKRLPQKAKETRPTTYFRSLD